MTLARSDHELGGLHESDWWSEIRAILRFVVRNSRDAKIRGQKFARS